MKTKLGKWTINAKKWREENGYTTPEWEMFVENRSNVFAITGMVCTLIGVICGILIS